MKLGIQGYDIIMHSDMKEDVFFEIKYFKNAGTLRKLNRVVKQLAELRGNYITNLKRNAVAKILIILPSKQYDVVTKDTELMMLIHACEYEIILLNDACISDLKGDFLNLNP